MPDQASGASVWISALQAALGDAVLVGDAIPEAYTHDWSGLPPVRPAALVRPHDTDGVAATLRIAHAHGVAVVPQGGRTGLTGGAQPIAGGLVLSLDRLTGIEEIDPVMATVTVKAGTPLQIVQQEAADVGLLLGIDLGARGSCQIGGVLSTNAGGNRVIRYGMARDHVLGLEVVLADGTIVTSLNKLIKNNAGYDIKQMFLGSEGTLGIITRAVLRLQARPLTVATMFCGCADFSAVIRLLQGAREKFGPKLSAFEVMWPSFYHFITTGLPHLRRPFADSHGFYVLAEISGFDAEHDQAGLEDAMAVFLEGDIVTDAVVGASEKDAQDLWAIRDSVSEYGRLMGPLTSFDIGLPISKMAGVAETVEARLRARWPDVIALIYGHVGDSNLHVIVNVPAAGADQPHDIVDIVLGIARDAGGTISAEHGIGLLKKDYLGYTRSPAELAVMATLKRALDPSGILNPGKVLLA